MRIRLDGTLSLTSFCRVSEESEPMRVLSVCADAGKAAASDRSMGMKNRFFIEKANWWKMGIGPTAPLC